MYDASGVRLHAGRQASVLNMIITELPPDHPVSDTRPLRDSLGHTPLQVQICHYNMVYAMTQSFCPLPSNMALLSWAYAFIDYCLSLWLGDCAMRCQMLVCAFQCASRRVDLQVGVGAMLGLVVGYIVGVTFI